MSSFKGLFLKQMSRFGGGSLATQARSKPFLARRVTPDLRRGEELGLASIALKIRMNVLSATRIGPCDIVTMNFGPTQEGLPALAMWKEDCPPTAGLAPEICPERKGGGTAPAKQAPQLLALRTARPPSSWQKKDTAKGVGTCHRPNGSVLCGCRK